MKKTVLGVALGMLLAGAAFAGEAVKGQWTGWVTDSHCGARGANKDHTAACVEKCMKTGKAQLWIESEKKGHDLTSFDKVKPLVGSLITVTGTMDKDTGAITVESAAKAAGAAN